MRTIWKNHLQITDSQDIAVPTGATPLTAMIQGGRLTVWYHVPDTEADISWVHISVVGTGNPIDPEVDLGQHVGSVINGPFVWHVYWR